MVEALFWQPGNGFAASFMPDAEKSAALAAFDSAMSSPPS